MELSESTLWEELSIHCGECCGLCCVALYCARSEGFPADKAAGVPCKQLSPDFCCAIHGELRQRGLKGCTAYDCFGAGQKVTRLYSGADWQSSPGVAQEMFQTFLTVFQLHQMLWYLAQARELAREEGARGLLTALLEETRQDTLVPPSRLLALDLAPHRLKVNRALQTVGRWSTPGAPRQTDFVGKRLKTAQVENRDLSFSLLIAANLEGCSLGDSNLLGADLRDANLRDADLSRTIFLTQGQVNSARGSSRTALPPHLARPSWWR